MARNVWDIKLFNNNARPVPPRAAMLDAPYEASDIKVAEYVFESERTLNIGAIAASCVRGLSFRLRAGAEYEVVLEPDCRLVARELNVGSQGNVRRDFIRNVGSLICE